jgi:hypothetical protein
LFDLFNSAEYFGMPLLPPSQSISKNFTQGANFAVIGATALPLEYFRKNSINDIPPINSSLPVQLEWFDDLKRYICNSAQGMWAVQIYIFFLQLF